MSIDVRGEGILHRLFLANQETLRAVLLGARTTFDHPTQKGDVSEAHWREMLAKHLPRRYRVCRGVVVDSYGAQSDAIDVIIHDAHFCPLLVHQGETCFVPAESVYAVFEAKQTLTAGYVKYAGEKAESVRRLHRTSAAIVERGESRPPRTLPPILAGILSLEAEWSDGLGESFVRVLTNLPASNALDIGCALSAGSFALPPGGAGSELVRLPAEVALGSFFIALVARLQLLGTVPAIDWTAYANGFLGA